MIKWNEVTWYSKLLAIIFFIGVLPMLSFYVGNKYGEVKEQMNQPSVIPVSLIPTPVTVSSSTVTTVDTSDWKTYRNEKYGFEFKYPPNYSVAPYPYMSDAISLSSNEKFVSIPKHQIIIGQISNSNEISQNDFEKMLIEKVTFDPSGLKPKSFSEFREIKIGDHLYNTITSSRFEGTLSIDYFFKGQSGIFEISSTSQGTDWTNPNLDIENDSGNLITKKILSTLEFTR